MNNDWISEREDADMKRKAYNDLQNAVANLTDRENMFAKVCTVAILGSATFLISAALLALGIRILNGVF